VGHRPHPHDLRPPDQGCVAKRTATGDSRKEIMRPLQRYTARELYPLIINVPVTAEALA
jgi:hypothetical protein